jgi:hypothetical protein
MDWNELPQREFKWWAFSAWVVSIKAEHFFTI